MFEDGSTCRGRLIVGCDGSHSQVRHVLYRELFTTHKVPVRLFGFTLRVSAEEAAPILELDPFFLQGTASSSNIYMYLSRKFQAYIDVIHWLILHCLVLEAPQKPGGKGNGFLYQICISWKRDNPALENDKIPQDSLDPADRVNIIRDIVQHWAEPFRSFVLLITDATNVKQLDLDDCAPENTMKPADKVMLVGDALHGMTMCKPHTTTDERNISRIAAKAYL
jgi:2-polyprenyl-6-methoxyphenol hydroxylase-like FAD-dependent oxidoreductase